MPIGAEQLDGTFAGAIDEHQSAAGGVLDQEQPPVRGAMASDRLALRQFRRFFGLQVACFVECGVVEPLLEGRQGLLLVWSEPGYRLPASDIEYQVVARFLASTTSDRLSSPAVPTR
ncbi:hypothetical protein GCM10009078_22510 [Cupriavidus gilardii]